MCVHIDIHICSMYMCVHIHEHVHIHTYMYTCTYTTCMYVYVYICVYMYTCTVAVLQFCNQIIQKSLNCLHIKGFCTRTLDSIQAISSHMILGCFTTPLFIKHTFCVANTIRTFPITNAFIATCKLIALFCPFFLAPILLGDILLGDFSTFSSSTSFFSAVEMRIFPEFIKKHPPSITRIETMKKLSTLVKQPDFTCQTTQNHLHVFFPQTIFFSFRHHFPLFNNTLPKRRPFKCILVHTLG